MFIRSKFVPLYRAIASCACVFLVCRSAACLAGAGEPDAGKAASPTDSGQIASRLGALTPKYLAPPAGILSLRDEYSYPLALLGVDLAQEGLVDSPGAPTLTGQRPLTVTAFWIPRTTVNRPVDIEVRVMSANPLITRSQKLQAGPVDGPAWNPGNVYRQEYSVDLARVARAFTGNGALAVGISLRSGPTPQYVPLHSIPFSLAPHVEKSSVAADALQASFGKGLRDLGVNFILGSNARQTLTVDPALRDGVVALGVVSAFGYGGLSQGAPVCEIVFTDENNQTARAAIVCGVDTARADYDFSSPEKANHKKAPIVESGEAVDFNAEGRAFRRHKYGATISKPENLGRVASLEFRGLTDRIFEVYDVVLLYGQAAK